METKEDIIAYIMQEVADNDVYPHHLLIRVKKIGGNMVINNYGTIMFNMAGIIIILALLIVQICYGNYGLNMFASILIGVFYLLICIPILFYISNW